MIYVVRHGETFYNKNGITHGQSETLLTTKGFNQASKVGEQLKDVKFDVCYCSPLNRAKQTAAQILKYHNSTKIIYDNRLKEIYLGTLEKTYTKIWDASPFGGETKIQFFNRVKSCLDEIEKKYRDKNVLIVCHSGTVKMCMFYFNFPTDLTKAYKSVKIDNCNIQTFDFKKKVVNKMKVGLYPMVADVLHTGHILALEEAKNNCDYLIVGLHCNPNYKNPVQSIYERYIQLRAVKYVDEVIPYTDVNDMRNLLLSLNFDVYFLGEDHEGKTWECDDVVKGLNKEIHYLSRKHPYSSSYLKERICAAEEKKHE